VISFALVGIIGLFPVAMQSALDSQRETQVAFIARSLFSELQRVDGKTAYITKNDKDASGKRPPLDEGTLVPIDLNQTTSKAFPPVYFDEDGIMTADNDRTRLYSAVITVAPTGQAGLARVDVNIAVPQNAPAANQKKYNFVSLINFTPPATTP
jgi:hypothetical protein